MNYGKSAYTKVLELEKRIGDTTNGESVRIFDSGNQESYTFSTDLVINSSKLIVEKNNRIYFKISFDLLCTNSNTIKAEYFIDGIVVATKQITLNEGQKQSVYLEFTSVASSNKIDSSYIKLTANNKDGVITLDNYKLIVINASGETKTQKNGIELRACKTPNDTYIISYTKNGLVWACEINNESSELDFNSIIYASSHCFAFDKSGQLHLYYVDKNNLYDKTVGSSYNDVLLASNVANVYAIKTTNFNSSDIVVCFISLDNDKVFYTCLEGENYGEIKTLNLPNLKFVDLSMVSGSEFVYLVLTSEDGTSFLLKSAYEPLSNSMFENITSNLAVLTQKYYTLGDYSDELLDTIQVAMSINASIVENYEMLIEKIAKDTINATFSKNIETYELAKEEPVLYTVIIDKTNRNYTSRCVYADDAVGLEPMVNVLDQQLYTNGWEDRFPLNKIKPCVLKGGKFLGYLNKNDFTLYEDGTPVNSDGQDNFVDIMIEFPKIYYSIENVDPYIYVHISNYKVNDNYKCYAHVYDGKELDKIYISAYHCGYKNYNGKNTMFSFTNTYPNCYDVTTTTTYSELLDNKEVGYRILNLDQTILLQCLFIVIFKSTGSQGVFTSGNIQSGVIYPNGYCDKHGMFSCDYANPLPCKMFGLENIFGNCYTRVEGFNIEASPEFSIYKIKRRNPYSDTPLNKNGDGYDEFYNDSLNGINVESFFLNDPYGTTELGFLANSQKYNGLASNFGRFYCDKSFIATSYGAWWGGDGSAYTGSGIFHYKNDKGLDFTENYYGYRLVYYPI